ncbi:acyl-phosphate glycerol 3-phosphate acyltransferase [Fusobacterium nucleatum]|uniref:Glycerol-3-phosphate acyltransferase n=3 Tax=Fusobacterium TaxID=848 RepID=A0A133P5Z5_FUSNU|nr:MULTISPECIES: glycerol-3-phosphate 1-O-acyltransferase PlsY [Fusobacterium]EEW95468.1 glycerol-3-phosphate acyltransferase [Fusobacterium animalis 3_1_33]ERT31071.1 glycerol-3-phosphate acyltransferase [Fusobacterium nucleatum CTI-5]EUB32348.1 acyl-phosphate glycerol 3-phosphate acyltransferase [Fusobacterium sp. CM1]KXA23982.1 acyl-phosphate glycerol 3-phosphate acyltransferase [Fusobacterium nucleatum]MCL4576426.1 glycerol-3-phosphate acyltransferase [Fusobacterium nucleatum YWH7056]
MTFFCLIILSYFFGAIPSGVWIGKIFKNIDVRDYGSKNSGATNSYRVLGAKLGIAVLIIDVLKGFIPLYIASKFNLAYNDLVILGLVAILAHTFSCFISFKGGKGVATSLGVFLFLAPVITLILLVIFILVVYFTKYISLGSITAAFLLPIFTFFTHRDTYLFTLSVVIAIFVIYRHKTNISRLLSGTENKFKF